MGFADDPSLALVTELTAQMDWDAMTETGMASHGGGADKVVSSLTDDERLELGRLLRAALGASGA